MGATFLQTHANLPSMGTVETVAALRRSRRLTDLSPLLSSDGSRRVYLLRDGSIFLIMGKPVILDLCGGTGSWAKPWRDAGYDVRTITLPDNDVRLYVPPTDVLGVLAAPPCTEFSFAKHFHGKGKYEHNFLAGLEVVSACMRIILTVKPKWWAIENPLGYLKNWLGEPHFVFEPWQFGDPYQKRTALWGEFKPPTPTVHKKPSGVVKFSMLRSKDIHPEYYGILPRQARRAITPHGFAQAFYEANK